MFRASCQTVSGLYCPSPSRLPSRKTKLITLILLGVVVALVFIGGIYLWTQTTRLGQTVNNLGSQIGDLTTRVDEAEKRPFAAQKSTIAAESRAAAASGSFSYRLLKVPQARLRCIPRALTTIAALYIV